MQAFDMGYAVPTFVAEVLPGDSWHIKPFDVIRLDTFAAPVMDTLYAIHDWYYVRNDEIWEGWERFITDLVTDQPTQDSETIARSANVIPWIPFTTRFTNESGSTTHSLLHAYGPMGIMTHLGVPKPLARGANFKPASVSTSTASECLRINGLSFLAVQKIYDDWFRDEEMERPSLDWPLDHLKHGVSQASQNLRIHTNGRIIFDDLTRVRQWRDDLSPGDMETSRVFDYISVCRRANWEDDYLTTRRPNPQRGDPMSVPADGTVDDFKEALSMQNVAVAKQRTGGDLYKFVKKFYGVEDHDGPSRKCRHLGRHVVGLDISDVVQTSQTTVDDEYQDGSPQGNVTGLSKTVAGSGEIDVQINMHGFIIRISRVIPRTTYHYGIDQHFLKSSNFEYFHPQLEAIGWQPVPMVVVNHCSFPNSSATKAISRADAFRVSGYQPPYEDYRHMLSRTKGKMNVAFGDARLTAYSFARDYSDQDSTGTVPLTQGVISPTFRKCDPTNAPMATIIEEGSQVHCYFSFDITCSRVVPHVHNPASLVH